MKRLHVHVAVKDIPQSIGFYSALFAAKPAVVKDDYAKWMLDDPRVNFAISTGGAHDGVGHLGIQVDSEEELTERSTRARDAAGSILVERGAQCCYATGNKAWTEDPQGVRWETFRTTGALESAGDGAEETFIDRGGEPEPLDSPACGCVSRKEIKTAASCCA